MLSACGGGGSSDPTAESNDIVGAQPTDEQQASTNAETPSNDDDSNNTNSSTTGKYAGDYSSLCTDSGLIFDWNITATIATETVTYYDDEECITPTYRSIGTYDMHFPGGNTTTDFGEADHVDFTAKALNTNGVNTPIPVTGNLTRYTIIILDGINLYIGRGVNDDGSSPENRSPVLSDLAHIRQ